MERKWKATKYMDERKADERETWKGEEEYKHGRIREGTLLNL